MRRLPCWLSGHRSDGLFAVREGVPGVWLWCARRG